jgi:hypothetical protein
MVLTQLWAFLSSRSRCFLASLSAIFAEMVVPVVLPLEGSEKRSGQGYPFPRSMLAL